MKVDEHTHSADKLMNVPYICYNKLMLKYLWTVYLIIKYKCFICTPLKYLQYLIMFTVILIKYKNMKVIYIIIFDDLLVTLW